jgi:hypothetical protein
MGSEGTLQPMKWTLFSVGAAVLVGLLGIWIRSRSGTPYHVTLSQIPQVLDQLSSSTSTPAFAVFLLSSPDLPSGDDVLNIQFSMENGHPGFDWVLLAPRNISDEQRFIDFARSAGYKPTGMEGNGVRYLRVESGDLTKLCSSVITDLYRLPKSSSLEMIVEGFDWKP